MEDRSSALQNHEIRADAAGEVPWCDGSCTTLVGMEDGPGGRWACEDRGCARGDIGVGIIAVALARVDGGGTELMWECA